MQSIRPPRSTIVVLLFSLCACGKEGAARSDVFATRDSAGVQIAESTGPAWADGDGWRLSEEPVLEIGLAEGAPEYLLNGVRSALRTGTGEFVVSSGTSEFRIYDATGKHLRTVGRRGGGPGEFQLLARLDLLSADSILAYDMQARRLSFFSPQGDFVRSAALNSSSDLGLAPIVGVLEDGSLVAYTAPSGASRDFSDGMHRSPRLFLHLDATGALLDSIALQSGEDRFIRTESSPGSQMMRMSSMKPLFGRAPVYAVAADRVILGDNESYQLEVFSPEGRLQQLIRRLVDPRPVTDAVREAAIQARLGDASTERRQAVERMLADIPVPETVPFYEKVLADDAGNLWVQDFTMPGEAAPGWAVLDGDGRFLGMVALPDGFQPMQMGEDFVLGVFRDDLDVERVRVYALEK